MKNFVCLFPPAENVHLYKEIGMIPYYMAKEFGYDACVACYEERLNLSYLDDELKEINHIKLEKRFKSETLNCLTFLWQQRNQIHTLMMIHISLRKVFLMIFIKMITLFRVKVYVKMDANPKYFNLGFEKRNFINRCRIFCYNLFDLVSVETKDLFDFFNVNTDLKVTYVPNGFTDLYLESYTSEKQNIILTVARLDDPIKNIDLLLHAFCNAKMQNWDLVLVGNHDNEFKIRFDNFIKTNPHLTDKIALLGGIFDKKKLNTYYERAKVFALPSNSEGFALTYLEAISNGCFVISTNLPAARDVTALETYGKLFGIGNLIELTNIFVQLDSKDYVLPKPQDIKNFAFRNFHWINVVKRIELGLKST